MDQVMQAALLEDRGAVEVRGPEAGEFLQRLFTNDVLGLKPVEARYAALLSPQGKILVDFLVIARQSAAEVDYLLDCPRLLAPDLTKRLAMYRLRAKATITDRSAEIGIAAVWPDRPTVEGLVYRDPRTEELGFRVAAARSSLIAIQRSSPEDYHQARIRAGVPEGGIDFAYGEAFPHEANLDRLHGLDFTKGCYVGQEVVSRVQHRGTARKRVIPVAFDGAPPPAGAPILAGESEIGTMGSAVEDRGLAMVRIDRAVDALASGSTITCAGTPMTVRIV